MPLLLNVLRNANTSEYRKLRAKAMECAGLIGIPRRYLASPMRYSRYIPQPLRSGAKFFEPMQAHLLNSSFEYRVCFPRFSVSRSFSADVDGGPYRQSSRSE